VLTREEIKAALRDRKIPVVASEVGISRQTIYTLMKDGEAKPNKSTLRLLSEYLERPL